MKRNDSTIRNMSWKNSVKSGFELLSLRQLRERKKRFGRSIVEPQRLGFHMLLLFEQGSGSHMVDFQDHECRRGTLIHVSPNQVHSFGENSKNKGTLLVLRPEVLPNDFYGIGSCNCPPPEYVWPPATRLNKVAMEFATTALKLISTQQMSPGVWRQPIAARHLIISFASFAYATAVAESGLYEIQPQLVFFEFLAMVEDSFSRQRDAKWYANELSCSYRTLCRACKAAADETPKAIIDQRVATEARRLLAFTGDSVSDIADELGFSESTNFVKFFQRVSKETPDSFRRHWGRDQLAGDKR